MGEKVEREVVVRCEAKRQLPLPLHVESGDMLIAGEMLEQVQHLDEGKKAELRDMVKKLLYSSSRT